MKTVKSIIFVCIIAHIQVTAMDNNSISPAVQEFANLCYEAGVNDTVQATGSQMLNVLAQVYKMNQNAKNNIIIQKFYAKQLTTANSDRQHLETRLHINETIRYLFQTQVQRQDTQIETLTNQRNAALNRIQRMQQSQLYALGSAAIIALIDPIEKQYLLNTTGLSTKEIDDKMIAERLFLLSALAVCHPLSAAIFATSAVAIKVQQHFQTSNSKNS